MLVDGFFPECAADDGAAAGADGRLAGTRPALRGRPGGDAGTWRTSWPARRGRWRTAAARQEEAAAADGGAVQRRRVQGGPAARNGCSTCSNEWATGQRRVRSSVLPGADLDLAVARGAAYYGLVRRGKGVRIRGGTARAYYIGVETSLPAVPGVPPPIKALCVVPFGMEEGTEADVPGQEFGLVVGEPAEFRFLGSTTRRDDAAGTLVEEWEGQIEELARCRRRWRRRARQGRMVPVHLHSKVTEVGTLELWCISRDGKQRWKLEFNVREKRG